MLGLPDRESRLDAKAALFTEGDAAGDIHELVSGVVRLSRMLPDDRREVLGFLFPGELFSSSGFGLPQPDAAICTADAVTSIRVTAHPWSRLDDVLAERDDFARKMLAAIRRNRFRDQQQMLLLGRMSALERVVWFLLVMARLENTEDDVPLYLPMPWDDVADYLGITTEAVSHVFFQLRKHGLIKFEDGSTIRVMSWRSMRLLARGAWQQKGWWSRQVAEALGDVSEPDGQILVEHVVRCDRRSLQALSQTPNFSADRVRQVQVQAIGKLRQQATKPLQS
jgi:CRP/FNR family transcriptional regulator, anaerobic regulatory protein